MQMLVYNLHMSSKEKVSHHPQCASSKFHSYLHNPDAASNHIHHIAPVKHMPTLNVLMHQQGTCMQFNYTHICMQV